MLHLMRAGFVGGCCVLAVVAAPFATAASAQKAKAIQATQRLTTLSSSGSSLTNVGTSEGKIGGASVHGALRAVVKVSATKFTAMGTLFYATGTLKYTLNGTTTSNPDGSLGVRGTGTFTDGTGNYTGAHGKFTGSGTKPANSFETFTLKGHVTYR